MLITKKYLVALTEEAAPEIPVSAKDENGNELFQLQIRASQTGQPFYLDVERLMGKTVFFYTGEKAFSFDGEADFPEAPADEAQRLRPKRHYTVPYGWLNDPNGLIFYNGKYHIFCQHNPLGTAWGNMHWHHSVTEDFVQFTHLSDALFPDNMGTMFSGSAVCDVRNVSGFGNNTLLLFYTIAEYSRGFHKPRFTQGLAYSADGIHFTKYAGNPIVPNIRGENRDPKVVYVPEMLAYVMALYLDGDEYCLLKSDNLLHWERFQTVRIAGDGECPDLYRLQESGKWILSGASDYYIVGRFDESGFVAEQEPVRFFRELDGRCSYAAQSFSGIDDRVLRLSWENIRPGDGQCFCGQLSMPMELSLVTLPGGFMRLRATLSREIESRLIPVQNGAFAVYEINSSAYVADMGFDGDFTVSIDGTVLQISVGNNTISLGKKSIPLSLSGKRRLRLIVDKMSVELLADDGLIFSCVKALCDKDCRRLTVLSGTVTVHIYTVAD